MTLRASLECFHSALDEWVIVFRKEDAGIDSSLTSGGCDTGCPTCAAMKEVIT